jgi:CRP-like cAMP-binding protein
MSDVAYCAEVLSDVPGLGGVPAVALEELAREFTLRSFDDQIVCREGEPSDTLFILAEGDCEVIKTAPNARRYKVAMLTPGCLFGHVGVMTLALRTATVRARGHVKVLEMSARRARQLLQAGDLPVASPFRRALIVALSRQLGSATATTMKLAIDAGLDVAATRQGARPVEGGEPEVDLEWATSELARAHGQV